MGGEERGPGPCHRLDSLSILPGALIFDSRSRWALLFIPFLSFGFSVPDVFVVVCNVTCPVCDNVVAASLYYRITKIHRYAEDSRYIARVHDRRKGASRVW